MGIAVLIGSNNQEQRIDMLFRGFDLDGDGLITRAEAEQVIGAIFTAGGGVEGVWGGQNRDVPPEAQHEYAMFKNVLDRIFDASDGSSADGAPAISRSHFDTCVRDFN